MTSNASSAPSNRPWLLLWLAAALMVTAGCQAQQSPRRGVADGGQDLLQSGPGIEPLRRDSGAGPPGVDRVSQPSGATEVADGAPGPGPDAASGPDLVSGPPCTVDEDCALTPTPLCESGACAPCPGGTQDAAFVEEDIPDGTTFWPGESFTKRWRLKNSGSAPWSAPCGFRFRQVSGEALSATGEVTLQPDERVGGSAEKDWLVPMQAPNTPGNYTSTWRMARDASGLGDSVWVKIKVSPCGVDADCKDPVASRCQPDGSCAPPPCVADSDCTDPGKPHCAYSGCAACASDAHCPASAPSCTYNICIDPNACGNGPKPSQATTVWPVPGKAWLCKSYGVSVNYMTCKVHTGIDICAQKGDPVLAVASGRVVHVGYMWLDGVSTGRGPYAIIVEHSPGFFSTYSHNDSALVKVGDCVTTGQQIATIGNLGYGTDYHLHFEMLDDTLFTGDWATPFNSVCQKYVNPMLYLQQP